MLSKNGNKLVMMIEWQHVTKNGNKVVTKW